MTKDPTLVLAPKEAAEAAHFALTGGKDGAGPASLRRSSTALAPNTAKITNAALSVPLCQQPNCVVVSCTSFDALTKLHAAMARSRSTMQAVAGLLAGSEQDDESSDPTDTADDNNQQTTDQVRGLCAWPHGTTPRAAAGKAQTRDANCHLIANSCKSLHCAASKGAAL